MKDKPYKRRPGDLEIRLLTDGRVVFIGPDQALVELARGLEGQSAELERERIVDDTEPGSTGPCK